jgi:hypothetical protein
MAKSVRKRLSAVQRALDGLAAELPAAADSPSAPDLPADLPPEPPAVWPGMSWDDYAAARVRLGLDQLGLDRGQVQQRGYRGDTPMRPGMPGAGHAAAARALAAPYAAARADYARRQHAAAQLTRSDRSM